MEDGLVQVRTVLAQGPPAALWGLGLWGQQTVVVMRQMLAKCPQGRDRSQPTKLIVSRSPGMRKKVSMGRVFPSWAGQRLVFPKIHLCSLDQQQFWV